MSFIPPDPSLTLSEFSNLIGGSPTEVSLPDGSTAWISPSPNEGTTITILDDGTIVLEGPPDQQLGFFSPDTNLNIRIVGSSQADVIVTGGNSTIEGADGADTIQITGEGNTYVLGGRDNDRITGGNGDDTLRGGKGDDYITGGEGDSNDLLFGDLGNDTLGGRGGNDTIYGGKGDDCIGGHEGDDVLLGDMGDDSVYGGVGNDTVRGGKDNDIVDGEEGNDLVLGDRGNDTVLGGTGNDTVHGGKGNDLVNGGEGDDILSGEMGDDTIIMGWGNNLASGGEGADVFEISVSSIGQVNNIADLGIDTLTDFSGVDDIIRLDSQIFTELGGPGTLNPNELIAIASFDPANPGVAGTANLVYDDATGSIYYIDTNIQATKILELSNKPLLSPDDFEII